MQYIAQSLVAINDRSVLLKWNKIEERDMAGYNLYMAAGVSTDFVRVNAALLKEASCTSPLLRPDMVYSFRITSVDTTGNESLPSETIEFRLRDYKEDAGLIIVPAPYNLRILAHGQKEVVGYPDFMTQFIWQDTYLGGRMDIELKVGRSSVKTIFNANFTTMFTLGG
jgi:hypothetical protein